MNKRRRKALDEAKTKLIAIREEIEALRDEEQEYYDNMPENIQWGDRGAKVQEAIDFLDGAVSDIENAESQIECSCD